MEEKQVIHLHIHTLEMLITKVSCRILPWYSCDICKDSGNPTPMWVEDNIAGGPICSEWDSEDRAGWGLESGYIRGMDFLYPLWLSIISEFKQAIHTVNTSVHSEILYSSNMVVLIDSTSDII